MVVYYFVMSDTTRKLVFLLMLLTVINSVAVGVLYLDVKDTSSEVNGLEEKNKEIESYLVKGGEFSTTTNLSTVKLQRGDLLVYESGQGVVVPYTFQPLPTRTTYLDVGDVSYDTAFQESLAEAQIAAEKSSYEPSGKGFALDVDEPDDWGYASGKSAGLPIALQVAATDDDVKLKDGVAATGRVNTEGRVLSVDGVRQKTLAAKDAGYDTVITPYTKTNIDVSGVEIVHVNDFDEAADYALVPAS